MAFINWKDSFSVNILKIDNQHRELLSMINELHEAMKTGKAKNILSEILNRLVKYTLIHFKTEEDYFKIHNYPQTAEHLGEHSAFVEKVADFKLKFENGNLSLSIEIMRFLSTWIEKHITVTDKAYTSFLNEKGVK